MRGRSLEATTFESIVMEKETIEWATLYFQYKRITNLCTKKTR